VLASSARPCERVVSKRLAERLADDPTGAAAAVIQPTSLHLVGGRGLHSFAFLLNLSRV